MIFRATLLTAILLASGCGPKSPPGGADGSAASLWTSQDQKRCGDDPVKLIDEDKLLPLDESARCRVKPEVSEQCASDSTRSLHAPLTCPGTRPPFCQTRHEQRLATLVLDVCQCLTDPEIQKLQADCLRVQ